MKPIFTIKNLPLIVAMLFTLNSFGQMTSQTVSISPGYTNQTFYSMNNGVLSSVSNTDWDLGFQLRGFAASILINSKNNVHLYRANKDISQWASMTAYDTTGIVSDPSYELFNSDTSWDFGAFNITNDTANAFDLGWGLYDFNTHAITGDSLYFLKLSNGDYKKFWLESLTGGIYTFRWADLDGANEISSYINKSSYQGKFFVYQSISNNTTIDREPVYNTWDLTFQQYLSLTPFIYKVTGVLSNDSVSAAKAYPVDVVTTTNTGQIFSDEINKIGYDWKAFDFNTNVWTIADSTCYFLRDRQGNYWKITFTGFGGAADGNFYFDQEPATPTGISETGLITALGIFPNPARSNARLMLDAKTGGKAELMICDVTGRQFESRAIQLNSGVQAVDMNLEHLLPGLYQVVITQGNERQVSRIVIQ